MAVRADDDPARIGESRTASFALPPEITALVHGGMELGDAIDQVFRRVGSKRRGGAVGLLTEGVIGRDELIAPAVVLALIPHLRRDLYDDDGEFPRGSRLGARAPVPG